MAAKNVRKVFFVKGKQNGVIVKLPNPKTPRQARRGGKAA